MQTEPQAPEGAWLKTIPYSAIDYPDSATRFLRVGFWRAYMPIHYLMRNSLAPLNFLAQKRKDFILGKIAPHLSMEEFVGFLVKKGYGNHFVAWKYKGEVVSLRYVENFTNQYHIRIFEDGNVWGHYEHTPESRPFTHMKEFIRKKETGIEDRSEYFYSLLGDRIVPHEK